METISNRLNKIKDLIYIDAFKLKEKINHKHFDDLYNYHKKIYDTLVSTHS